MGNTVKLVKSINIHKEEKMQDLTFGEQVKIILGRKGMTIKQLAELIEEKQGRKCRDRT